MLRLLLLNSFVNSRRDRSHADIFADLIEILPDCKTISDILFNMKPHFSSMFQYIGVTGLIATSLQLKCQAITWIFSYELFLYPFCLVKCIVILVDLVDDTNKITWYVIYYYFF